MRRRLRLAAVLTTFVLAGVVVWTAYASSSSSAATQSVKLVEACTAPPVSDGALYLTSANTCGGTSSSPPPTPPNESRIGVCSPTGGFTNVLASQGQDFLSKGYTFGIYVQGHGVGCSFGDFKDPPVDPSQYHLVQGVLADAEGKTYTPDFPGYGTGDIVYPYYALNS
jgi:hypothetical protein